MTAYNDILGETFKRLKSLYKKEKLTDEKLTKIVIKPQWNVVIGGERQSGIAINFTGKHAIYEEQDMNFRELQRWIGKQLFEVAEENFSSGDLQTRSIGIAAMSALSQPLLEPISMKKRGFFLHPWLDFQHAGNQGMYLHDFVRPTDIVVIVGYGGVVRRFLGRCRELHVTEMRPKELFQTIIIGDQIEYGPQHIRIHSAEENNDVLSRADVVIITGSTLVNGTFEKLLSYARQARVIGMYGPSASFIPDVLFEQGVNFVSSFRVTDQSRFLYDTINDVDMEVALKQHQQSYIAQNA
jgi:uncharacterized protein (DUF4213/DUF364 family)